MNREDDKLTTDMMRNSMREITNPEFDRILMHKVMNEDRKKFFIKRVSLYSLVFVVVFIPVIFALRAVLLDLDAEWLQAISASIIRNGGVWISENTYLAIPFIILLIVKSLVAFKLKHA